MEKTIREICLLCKGERWLDDPARPGQSKPCTYCESTGWVVVAEMNFSSEFPQPPVASPRKD